jgi:hypothetical protein
MLNIYYLEEEMRSRARLKLLEMEEYSRLELAGAARRGEPGPGARVMLRFGGWLVALGYRLQARNATPAPSGTLSAVYGGQLSSLVSTHEAGGLALLSSGAGEDRDVA